MFDPNLLSLADVSIDHTSKTQPLNNTNNGKKELKMEERMHILLLASFRSSPIFTLSVCVHKSFFFSCVYYCESKQKK